MRVIADNTATWVIRHNTVLELFQETDSVGDLQDSKSTREVFCVLLGVERPNCSEMLVLGTYWKT